ICTYLYVLIVPILRQLASKLIVILSGVAAGGAAATQSKDPMQVCGSSGQERNSYHCIACELPATALLATAGMGSFDSEGNPLCGLPISAQDDDFRSRAARVKPRPYPTSSANLGNAAPTPWLPPDAFEPPVY